MEVQKLREIIRQIISESIRKVHGVERLMGQYGIKRIPISTEGKRTLTAMAKEGFLHNGVSDASMALYYAYIENGYPLKPLKNSNMELFMNSLHQNTGVDKTSAIMLQAQYIAYQISLNVKDMKRNGEEIEPPYYLVKEHFNSFGMGTASSLLFNSSVEYLTNWMKRKGIQNEGVAYEKDMDETRPVLASGVMGPKSKPFRKKFKNYKAFEKWIDSNSENYEIHRVHNE
jgi:hypothetical protein